MAKDNLSGDISKLTPKLSFEAHPEPKGQVVNPYGTQKLTQPSDGDLADTAFERLGQPLETYKSASPPVTPKAMSDSEAADLAWKQLGK
jgi:hypothetical protein